MTDKSPHKVVRAALIAGLPVLLMLVPVPASAQKKVYDRGYDEKRPEAILAPKGSWCAGGSVGFGTSTQENYDFLIISGINSKNYNLTLCPQFCYMFADNMGIGARLKYTRGYLRLDSASAEIGKTAIEVRNYNYLGQKYLGAVFFRYYKPFGRSGRFGAFFDAEIAAGGSTVNVVDKDGQGGYSRGFNLTVGGNCGLVALLTHHLGIDVRVGLLEFGYASTKQENNVGSSTAQERVEGSATRMGANFMVDLFAISFGVHYYL